jgi:hypothetical protein
MCKAVKLYDFNLRLSINLTKYFDDYPLDRLFDHCRQYGADQVTLRRLYDAYDGSPQSQWVWANGVDKETYSELCGYVSAAPALRRLEYGRTARQINGMSVVLDDDCMAKGDNTDFKYLIIRPNGKLYSSWDDPASLIF